MAGSYNTLPLIFTGLFHLLQATGENHKLVMIPICSGFQLRNVTIVKAIQYHPQSEITTEVARFIITGFYLL
jgi:hypothetical protein